jgi:adenylate kinase family enzyme
LKNNQRNITRCVSIGDLLRAAVKEESELGRHIKSVLSSGGVVDDDSLVALVESLSGEGHTILDGFPRTVNQARKVFFGLLLHYSFPSAFLSAKYICFFLNLK